MKPKRKTRKFGLCADWQFSLSHKFSSPHPETVTSRLNDALGCFSWVVGKCLEAKCEALLILGDIFDSRTAIDLPVIDRVCRKVEEASKRIPLLMIPGNHDSYLRQTGINSLQMFSGVAKIFTTATVWEEFGFVPWQEDVEKFECDVLDVAKRGATILCSHALVEGAVPKGGGFSVSVLHANKFKRVFLGDVHNPVAVDSVIQYVGSPMQIDYRDADSPRGFFIYDVGADDLEYAANTVSPQFHLLTGCDFEQIAVEPNSYCRIRTGDEETSLRIQRELTEMGVNPNRIESDFVAVDLAPAVRLDVRSSDDALDVVRKYVEFAGVGLDAEFRARLVQTGRTLLEET